MKKLTFLFSCAVFIFASVDAKGISFTDTPRIISSNELSFEKIQELIQSKNSDFVIEFKEGSAIPIQFLAKARVFSATIDPNLVIKVDKTCYLRVANRKCYMSENLMDWEKVGKFFGGRPTAQLSPNLSKGGLVVEANIVPFQEVEADEE